MRIFVCIKQVPDTEARVKLLPDGRQIDEAGIKWVMNPYDEYAVEAALRIKEARGTQTTVTVVSVGPKARVADALRTALAMGADDAVLVDAAEGLDSFLCAKALSSVIKKEPSYDLVLTGKLAIDDNAAAVSQYVAEFLQIPHTTVVSKMELTDSHVVVEREVEGGAREVVEMAFPCVIAANKGLNTPRYASLPGIMKAKKKPLKELSLQELGLEGGTRVMYSNFQLPPEKPPVKMIAGDSLQQAKELARLLMDEAKVL